MEDGNKPATKADVQPLDTKLETKSRCSEPR